MIIHKPSQKVLLNLSEPDRVTTVIPTAKTFMYKGTRLVAVPHKHDETRVLRNLGFEVPSPIEHYYDWPGQYKPFEAQRVTAGFMTSNPKSFVFNDMGTGKTMSTLWAFDYLRSMGQAKSMLVVSPLSTLERAWADEVFRHFPDLTVQVLYGSKARRLKLLKQPADIYLINHDGIKTIEAELISRRDIDTVAIDEIASFRNASTSRWKSLSKICAGRERLWGLTGTPTPNLPTDAWAQCRLISPERVPKYFGNFRDATMKQLGPFKWLPRESSSTTVADAMQPSIRFARADCVDLPPCVYQDREVKLTASQGKAYKEMLTSLYFEVEQGQVTAINEAVKLSKLLQICCGGAYDKTGESIVLDAGPRIQETIDIIEQADGKALVFVPFTSALNTVTDALKEHFKGQSIMDDVVASVSGATPKNERDDIFHRFQKGDLKIIVANPGTLSHGLTLTASNTIIWFGPPFSSEQYQQANARISRPGQELTQFIVHIESTEIERRVYARLRSKQALQGLLLGIIHEERG